MKLSETIRLLSTTSTTTPPLALGSVFLVEESFFMIPFLHWGVFFLLKKSLRFKSSHEFLKYVQVKNYVQNKDRAATRSSCGGSDIFH